MYYFVIFKKDNGFLQIENVNSAPWIGKEHHESLKEEVDQDGWVTYVNGRSDKWLFKYPHYHFDEEVNPIDFPQSFIFLEYLQDQAVGKFIEKI